MMRDVINLTAPSHYALELGKQFSGIVASWDLEQRFCPTGRFTPDGHCRVAGNVSAVAAAGDAQPACSGRAPGPGSGGAAAAPPAGQGRRARAGARRTADAAPRRACAGSCSARPTTRRRPAC